MLLELKDIHKHFHIKKSLQSPTQVIKAVDGVNLKIMPREHVGLVGESGSGKSTLAKLITRLIPADSGQINFKHLDLTKTSSSRFREIRQDIQMVFQDPYSSLDPRFTIRRTLFEAMQLDKKKYANKEFKETQARKLLKDVHLNEDMLDRFPHEFSGGERQRIAIARALSVSPKLLILDEAVSSLDVIIQDEILALLDELQQKFDMTYLFISHNLRVVKRVCPTIAVMFKGKIVEMGCAQSIFHSPQHVYTQELFSAAVEYKAVDRLIPLEINPNGMMRKFAENHYVLE